MNIKYIYSKIRRQTILSGILPAAFLAFLIIAAGSYPFQDIFFPYHVTTPAMLETAYTSREDYVTLSNITLHYTGYDSVNNSKITGRYFYTLTDSKCFFFLLTSKEALQADTTITFDSLRLKLIPPDLQYNTLLTNLSTDIDWSLTHLSEVSPQFVALECGDILYYTYIYAGLLTIMASYTLLCLFSHMITFIFPLLQKGLFPKTPFASKKKLIDTLELELSDKASDAPSILPLFSDNKDFFVTPSFVINFSAYDTHILPLKDIIWIYKHTQKASHGISKMPSMYTLHLILTGGKHIAFKNYTEERANSLIALLASKNPNLLIGYSQEHKLLAKKYLEYLHKSKRGCKKTPLLKKSLRS